MPGKESRIVELWTTKGFASRGRSRGNIQCIRFVVARCPVGGPLSRPRHTHYAHDTTIPRPPSITRVHTRRGVTSSSVASPGGTAYPLKDHVWRTAVPWLRESLPKGHRSRRPLTRGFCLAGEIRGTNLRESTISSLRCRELRDAHIISVPARSNDRALIMHFLSSSGRSYILEAVNNRLF